MSLPQTSFPHLPIFSLSGPWPTNQAIHNCLQLHFPGGATGKETACNEGLNLGGEDLLEKGMATHSSIPAWRIPWTEEPGGLQSMGSQGVGHN